MLMKRLINSKKFLNKLYYVFVMAFLLLSQIAAQQPDIKLVEKYGLNITPYTEEITPAPEWLQKADMITMDATVWKGHKFILKDTLIERIVRIRSGNGPLLKTEQYPVETISSFDGSVIKGVPLISHVPHCKEGYEEAHKQGFKVIPYVHFTDIHSFYADQDVFMFQHPEILLKDENAHWVHIPMDGSDRAFRYLTCANSPSYWKLSLDYVKKMMDWGADGIFIDNIGNRRRQCFGLKYNVPSNSSAKNPEFPPYTHEHLFPDTTESYAWDRMLQTIRTLVKSYGDDKVVVINSGIGTPYQKNGDCCMWESFIYSWAWEGRRHTWSDVKKRAAENKWFLDAGRRITALSFLNPARKEVKDDAFWAFSAARLVDFIWWSDLSGTGADILYKVHMGKGLEPFKETNNLVYRNFENGIIVLNDNPEDKIIDLIIPAGIKTKNLLDIYNGLQPVQVKNKKIHITIPGNSARIYLISMNF